jgi:hypothetical protein
MLIGRRHTDALEQWAGLPRRRQPQCATGYAATSSLVVLVLASVATTPLAPWIDWRLAPVVGLFAIAALVFGLIWLSSGPRYDAETRVMVCKLWGREMCRVRCDEVVHIEVRRRGFRIVKAQLTFIERDGRTTELPPEYNRRVHHYAELGIAQRSFAPFFPNATWQVEPGRWWW